MYFSNIDFDMFNKTALLTLSTYIGHKFLFLNKYNIIMYLIVSDACGGIIEATNGTITSPSFPDLYPGNKSCIWEIIAPAQFKITLNFTHFDLEGNNVSY